MENLPSISNSSKKFALALLNEVPFFGIIQAAFESVRNIRDAVFMHKVNQFLYATGDISEKDKEEFLRKLESAGKKEELGTALLLLIEKADEIKKPLYIGRIMAAHMRGEIDYDTTLRLCYIISRSYTVDLKLLVGFQDGVQGDSETIADSLFSVGVLSNDGVDGGMITEEGSSGTIYSVNEYGRLIAKHALPNEK